MIEFLPITLLHGMNDPRHWVDTIDTIVTLQPPYIAPRQGRRSDGLAYREWLLVSGVSMPVKVQLIPYPDRVRLEIWTDEWNNRDDITYHESGIQTTTSVNTFLK